MTIQRANVRHQSPFLPNRNHFQKPVSSPSCLYQGAAARQGRRPALAKLKVPSSPNNVELNIIRRNRLFQLRRRRIARRQSELPHLTKLSPCIPPNGKTHGPKGIVCLPLQDLFPHMKRNRAPIPPSAGLMLKSRALRRWSPCPIDAISILVYHLWR